MTEEVNNLYRSAGFFSKIFNLWAGKYVRWVNKAKGIQNFDEVVFIDEKDKTQNMFEHFLTNMINLKVKLNR